jgi:hypothetical protein
MTLPYHIFSHNAGADQDRSNGPHDVDESEAKDGGHLMADQKVETIVPALQQTVPDILK